MKERVVLFGRDRSLVGIVTDPRHETELPTVLILNAGFLHRVGPSCLHVKLARRLSELGFRVLRFDFSGIGDSPASQEAGSFAERALSESVCAMDFLRDTCGAQSFLPMGICQGAYISFRLTLLDERVVGTVLVDDLPADRDVDDEEVQKTHDRFAEARFYKRRLLNLKSWAKLLRGKSDVGAIRRVVKRFIRSRVAEKKPESRAAPNLNELKELQERQVELFLVYSGGAAWNVFDHLLGAERVTAFENVQLERIKESDHLFTPLWAQDRLLDAVGDWTSGVYKTP